MLRQNKYRARPTGGYASAREAKRAAELKLLEKAGQIMELREQVPFLLIPTQRGLERVERPVKYYADFVYKVWAPVDGGFRAAKVVEDCKGVRTRDYIIKRKLMLMVHGIAIRET